MPRRRPTGQALFSARPGLSAAPARASGRGRSSLPAAAAPLRTRRRAFYSQTYFLLLKRLGDAESAGPDYRTTGYLSFNGRSSLQVDATVFSVLKIQRPSRSCI